MKNIIKSGSTALYRNTPQYNMGTIRHESSPLDGVTRPELKTKKKRIHIVGIHGVPAKYGGLETFADFLCQNLGDEFDITVYCNAHKYPEKAKTYFGAKLKYIPLDASGFRGILYDVLTYIDALAKSDVVLYLSPVGSGFMTPLKKLSRAKVIINHGGLNEWEREKLSWLQQKWAKFNHRIAAKFADINIVDNELYKESLKQNFNAESTVIRYGGDHVSKIAPTGEPLVKKYPFVKEKYAISISRAQVDNNLHMVLEAFEDFKEYKIVLLSNWDISTYGKKLRQKYTGHPNMILIDNIYDKRELDFVRGNAYLYIHSHSRCGTAPTLVEAMNLNLPVIAFDVPTNREATKNKAAFFTDSASLIELLEHIPDETIKTNRDDMYAIASTHYTWEKISAQYKALF